MFSGKKVFVSNDLNRCQKLPLTGSPPHIKVPHNTPEDSPQCHTPKSASRIQPGPAHSRTQPHVSSKEFENQLLHALINKIPGRGNSGDRLQSPCILACSPVPTIVLPPLSRLQCDNDKSNFAELSIRNLENYNNLNDSLFDPMEWSQSSSFSDQMSTMATCASEPSILDSSWDSNYSEEDLRHHKRRSLSLDSPCNCKVSKQCIFCNKSENFASYKTTSSVDNLHDYINL